MAYNLDYGPKSPIGKQSLFLKVTPDSFRNELSSSRTFLLESEAKALSSAGIGSRTTYQDLLVFGPNGVIDNVLRYPDECVRHKILDVVGDLSLLGKDIVGHVVAYRSGHHLNAELVRKILEADSKKIIPLPDCNLPLDIGSIMKTLPHRYPFLLVDRVLELVPDSHVARSRT